MQGAEGTLTKQPEGDHLSGRKGYIYKRQQDAANWERSGNKGQGNKYTISKINTQ